MVLCMFSNHGSYHSTQNANPLQTTIINMVNHSHSLFYGILTSLTDQKNVYEIRYGEYERDGQDTDELKQKYSMNGLITRLMQLRDHTAQITMACGQEYLLFLGEFTTRNDTNDVMESCERILEALIQTVFL